MLRTIWSGPSVREIALNLTPIPKGSTPPKL
jgi:hypothetical protein